MEREREFNDGVETGKRPVARPHFLDHDPAVARPENVDHAPGQNRVGKPAGRLLNLVLLRFDRVKDRPAFLNVCLNQDLNRD